MDLKSDFNLGYSCSEVQVKHKSFYRWCVLTAFTTKNNDHFNHIFRKSNQCIKQVPQCLHYAYDANPLQAITLTHSSWSPESGSE